MSCRYSGGAGSRTRVRMRAAVVTTCVFRFLISRAGARADAIPGQPVLVLSRLGSRARLPEAIPLFCGPSATRERAGDRPVGLTRPERSCRWQLLCSRPQYGGSGHRHATIHVHSPVETVSPPFECDRALEGTSRAGGAQGFPRSLRLASAVAQPPAVRRGVVASARSGGPDGRSRALRAL